MPAKSPEVASSMTNAQLAAYRERLGLTQRELAHRAGLGLSTLKDLERGYRQDGEGRRRPATISKTVELALAAIELGITSYDGRKLTEPAVDGVGGDDGAKGQGRRIGRPVSSKYAKQGATPSSNPDDHP